MSIAEAEVKLCDRTQRSFGMIGFNNKVHDTAQPCPQYPYPNYPLTGTTWHTNDLTAEGK